MVLIRLGFCIDCVCFPLRSVAVGLFICLIFISLPARAQKQAVFARLSELNDRPDKDTSDLSDMLNLTERLLKAHPDEASCWLDQVKKSAEKARYGAGLLEYSRQRFAFAKGAGKYRESADSIRAMLKRSESYLSGPVRQEIRWTLANVLYEGDFDDEAWALAETDMQHSGNPELQARWLWLRGGLNTNYLKYDEATADFMNSLAYYRKHKPDDEQVMLNLFGLAAIQTDLKNFTKAIRFNNDALKKAEKLNDLRRQEMAYCNIGVCYKNLDSTSLSLEYYKKSLPLARRLGDSVQVARNLMNIGNLNIELSRNKEALGNFQASLALCRTHNIPFGIMLNHLNTGVLYETMEQYDKAKPALDSAMFYAEKLKLEDIQARIHEHYAFLYEETRQYALALRHTKKFHELNSKIFGEEKLEKIAELEVKYEAALKDHKIELIDQKLSRKRIQNRLLALAIALLGLGATFAIYFMHYRNKTLRELYNRNVELLKTPRLAKVSVHKDDAKGSDIIRQVFDQLVLLVEKEGLYKNPNLSIGDVTERLMTNEKYVSSAISTYAKMNYNHFINYYRIQEAKRLINESPQAMSLSEVMYECGFNSRTTFYNAFQKFTGMSPKQFRSLAQSSAV